MLLLVYIPSCPDTSNIQLESDAIIVADVHLKMLLKHGSVGWRSAWNSEVLMEGEQSASVLQSSPHIDRQTWRSSGSTR